MKVKSIIVFVLLALVLTGAIAIVIAIVLEKQDTPSRIVKISYWTHSDLNRDKLEDRLIKEFMRNNPEVNVEVKRFSSSELFNIAPVSLSMNNGPTIVSLQSDYLVPLIEEGHFVPVNYELFGMNAEEIEKEYIPGTFKEVKKGDDILGIPMEVTNWCLFINKNKLREVGLDPETEWPKTWEEIVEVCSKLVKTEDGILVERGFDFRYPYYLGFLIPMVEQLGGSILNEEGKLELVNEEAWSKVIDYMREWGPTAKGLGSPTYVNARTLFAEEKIAMMLSGSYHIKRLEAINPEFYKSDNWMVVPFPQFENAEKRKAAASYSFFWTVNENASKRQQEEAWKLIKFFSEHEKEYLNEVGLINNKLSILELSENEIELPFIEVFFSDQYYSEPIYSSKNVTKVRDVLNSLFNETILSGIETDKAIIKLRVALKELSL